jgi:HEAT repeat protein
MFRQLLDPDLAESAAASIMTHASWLEGQPPAEALEAFGDPRHAQDSAVVKLAWDWDPEALAPALLQALTEQGDLARRQRLAWIVKLTVPAGMLSTLMALASNADEDRVVRRFLLDGICRLAFGGSVDWPSIAALVENLSLDPDSLIREAAAALAGIGEGHEPERIAVLVNMLSDANVDVVATAARALERYPGPDTYLPAQLRDRLLAHPSPSVRLAVQDLLSKPN